MIQKMNIRSLVVKMWVVAFLAASVGLRAFPVQTARGQVLAFLGTPYYGNATTISQWFDPPNHYGIDFLLRYERVLAAAEGTITELRWYTRDDRCLNDPTNYYGCHYGLYVRIDHAYDYDDYLTIYGHLSTAIGSTSGPESWVELGEVIGTSGNTGWSTGPHLHFEVRHDDVRVDPFDEDGVSLWRHGACTETDSNRCSGTLLPAPPQAESITIDDGDTGFSRGYVRPYSSPWSYATDAGYNGDTYYGLNTTSSTYYRWAKWKPSISSGNQGMYEIYVHVPSNHADTLRARYTVDHAYGSTEALIVQAALPHTGWPNSTWVNIGTYFLSPDSRSVEITNETDAWDAGKYVGADAVRFTRLAPTYLPDTRASVGWDSSVVVRPNGGAALTRVEHFDSSGNSECTVSLPVDQAGVWNCRPSLNCDDTDDIRSAVVYASQDVSVVVENKKTGETTNYNGVAAADPLNPGWGQVGNTIYAPAVKYNLYGRTSQLYVMNAGSSTATIIPTFHAQDNYGSPTTCSSFTVPSQGRYVYDPSQCAPYTGKLYGVGPLIG
jgi:murein DD-endopeptidase MepM/ murein hydrolase activator NlpD